MTEPKPDDEPNEILAAAAEAKALGERTAKAVADRAKNWDIGKIGIGVGIGSAAVAAAVLFANRPRPKK